MRKKKTQFAWREPHSRLPEPGSPHAPKQAQLASVRPSRARRQRHTPTRRQATRIGQGPPAATTPSTRCTHLPRQHKESQVAWEPVLSNTSRYRSIHLGFLSVASCSPADKPQSGQIPPVRTPAIRTASAFTASAWPVGWLDRPQSRLDATLDSDENPCTVLVPSWNIPSNRWPEPRTATPTAPPHGAPLGRTQEDQTEQG